MRSLTTSTGTDQQLCTIKRRNIADHQKAYGGVWEGQRMVLRVSVVCLVVILAGCSAGPADPAVESTPTSTATLAPGVHPGLTASLVVNIDIERPVHVTVREMNDGGRGLILNHTYTETTQLNEANDLDFRTNGDYHVTITVDGEQVWNRTVGHFETMEITVEQNQTVTVQVHTVA